MSAADLLLNRTNGFAAQFSHAVDAERVAVKAASVVTEYEVGDFIRNAGTSPKLVYDPDGILVWTPHNLAPASEDISNATVWTPTAGAALSPILYAPNSVATYHRIAQNCGSSVTGAPYTYSIIVSPANRFKIGITEALGGAVECAFELTGAGVILGRDVNNISATITDIGGGQYLIVMSWLSTGTSIRPHIYVLPAGYTWPTGFTSVWTGNDVDGVNIHRTQMNRGLVPNEYMLNTGNGPLYSLAVNHDPTAFRPHLLIEEARTNLCALPVHSWSNTTTVSTPNAAIAPNGLMDAVLVSDDTAGTSNANVGPLSGGISLASVTQYTFSVFLKAGSVSAMEIKTVNDDVGKGLTFDLVTLAITDSPGSATGTIQALPNGWFRVTMTWTRTSDTAVNIRVGFPGNTLRDGTHNFYAWGAQVEQAAFASSHIPTSGATVVRAADNYNFLLSAIPALGSEYSIYALASTPNIANARHVFTLTNGTATEYLGFRTDTSLRIAVLDGTLLANLIGGPLVANTPVWAASRIKLNDVAISVNGGAVVVDTAVTLPTVDQVRFGGNNAAALAIFSLYEMIIVPGAMTDAELRAQTSIQAVLAAQEAGEDDVSIAGVAYVSGALAAPETGADDVSIDGSAIVGVTFDVMELGADITEILLELILTLPEPDVEFVGSRVIAQLAGSRSSRSMLTGSRATPLLRGRT
jgi:hypothetical protein